MKLIYKAQMIVSVVIIILVNLLTDIFDFQVYRSIGFAICGLLWVIHPVLPNGAEVSKRTLLWTRIAGVILILIGISVCFNIKNKHTFTLTNDDGIIKSEQIQPVYGTVKVSGDRDTDVIFTDVETGEEYVIGYITHGVSETIKLEKDNWYTVEGKGNLVLSPVNVRIE